MIDDNIGKIFGLKTIEFLTFKLLLENNPRSAIELSGQLHISRVQTYNILKKLEGKGLITKKGSLFFAKDPFDFYTKIEKQEQELSIQKEYFKNLLELRNKTKIKVFSNESGLKLMSQELGKEQCGRGFIVLNGDFLPKYLDSRRSRKKTFNDTVIIFSNSRARGRPQAKTDNKIILPYKKQKKFSAITIFGQRVAICSYPEGKEAYGILIDDANLADFMSELIIEIKNKK